MMSDASAWGDAGGRSLLLQGERADYRSARARWFTNAGVLLLAFHQGVVASRTASATGAGPMRLPGRVRRRPGLRREHIPRIRSGDAGESRCRGFATVACPERHWGAMSWRTSPTTRVTRPTICAPTLRSSTARGLESQARGSKSRRRDEAANQMAVALRARGCPDAGPPPRLEPRRRAMPTCGRSVRRRSHRRDPAFSSLRRRSDGAARR